jgi:hypothetical protein
MNLIKEIVNSLKKKDPVQEAINAIDMEDPTQLEDDQVEHLIEYMNEMIAAAQKRGTMMPPAEAAHMAIEDIAGFETASPRQTDSAVNKLVQAYLKKFGS